jgi:hypothetical protein
VAELSDTLGRKALSTSESLTDGHSNGRTRHGCVDGHAEGRHPGAEKSGQRLIMRPLILKMQMSINAT